MRHQFVRRVRKLLKQLPLGLAICGEASDGVRTFACGPSFVAGDRSEGRESIFAASGGETANRFPPERDVV